jgi:hypothetical protein
MLSGLKLASAPKPKIALCVPAADVVVLFDAALVELPVAFVAVTVNV